MEVRAVGGQKLHKIDVQVVSATNRNLEDMVAARSFRSDLLYRLNGFVMHLPPLAARTDFSSIVKYLMRDLAPGVAITDAAITRLARYRWPGNIRELRSLLQRALISGGRDFIDETYFDEKGEIASDVCSSCRGRGLAERTCREIRAAYRACNGNVAQTARQLQLARTTIYKHLE
jgi:sigma-54 dependent transcriptional regulator, acetoin dehydrogenase operon transcriptional activator AcoR